MTDLSEYTRALAECTTQLARDTGVSLSDNGSTLSDYERAYVAPVFDKAVKYQRHHAEAWAAVFKLAMGSSRGIDVHWRDAH